ncbi:hypothetical protein U1Q18_041764 [Sarracenia purpurea var. burkii]
MKRTLKIRGSPIPGERGGREIQKLEDRRFRETTEAFFFFSSLWKQPEDEGRRKRVLNPGDLFDQSTPWNGVDPTVAPADATFASASAFGKEGPTGGGRLQCRRQ